MAGLGCGAFFGRRGSLASLALVVWLAAAGLGAQTPAKDAVELPAVSLTEGSVALNLAPSQARRIRMDLRAGWTNSLRVEQTAGSVEVQPLARGGDPRRNPAGTGAKIQFLLMRAGGRGADGGEARDESLEFSVRNLSAVKGAAAVLTVDAGHASSARDGQEEEAERAFAHAESLRLGAKKEGHSEIVRAYDAAIATWRGLQEEQALARALTWKAMFLFVGKSNASAALPLVEEAAGYAGGLETVEAANCLKIGGYVNVQLARYDVGERDYTAALRLYEKTGDLFNQEVLLDNRSRLERLEGKTDRALADAERADSLAQEVGDAKRQAKIKAEIGAVHLTASRLEQAYTAYQGALALLRQSPDPFTEGYVWSDLGVLYTLLREFDKARTALDEASKIWSRNPNPTGELNTLDDFGELWMTQGRLTQARASYQRGLAKATEQALPRPRIYLLRGLGATYLLENDLAQAERNLNAALALALSTKEGDGLAEIYCLLGDLHTRRRQFPAAEESYRRCGESTSPTDLYSSIRANGSLARLQFERGKIDAASALSERALAGIEAVRTAIPEQDLRTSFFSSMRSYYDLSIEILEALDRLHPGGSYAWEAFLTAERGRARMLLDQVHVGQAGGREGSPALRAEYEGVEAALRSGEKREGRVSGRRRAEMRGSNARLTVRRDALAAELAASGPAEISSRPSADGSSGSSSDFANRALTLASVQSMLPPGRSALLEYWTGQRRSTLWVITRGGVRSFRLPSAGALSEASRALLDAIFSVARSDPELTAEKRARALPLAEQQSRDQASRLRRLALPERALPARVETVLVVADGAYCRFRSQSCFGLRTVYPRPTVRPVGKRRPAAPWWRNLR